MVETTYHRNADHKYTDDLGVTRICMGVYHTPKHLGTSRVFEWSTGYMDQLGFLGDGEQAMLPLLTGGY